MNNLIVFPNDTHFIVPLSTLTLGVLASEMVTYPLDRLSSQLVAKSFVPINTRQIALEIWRVEGLKGFFRGFTERANKCVHKNILQYYTFNVIYNNVIDSHIFTSSTNFDPSDPSNPDLKYINFWNAPYNITTQVSIILGLMLTQTRYIVILNQQCDSLGEPKLNAKQTMAKIMLYHRDRQRYLFYPGLFSRYGLDLLNFNLNMLYLQQQLINDGYVFGNYHCGQKGGNGGLPNLLKCVGVATTITTLLTYPLKYLTQKKIMNSMRNLAPSTKVVPSKLYRGFFPFWIKQVIGNQVQVSLMWTTALHYKRAKTDQIF